jgi:lipoprotein-anchoring transpeptidase ErfK/SrfK
VHRLRPYRSLLVGLLSLTAVDSALLALARLRRAEELPSEWEAHPDSAPNRVRRWAAIAATAGAFLAMALVGGAFAYDATTADVVATGVRVGPVDLSGLSPPAARAKLRRAYRPLDRPLVVSFEGRRWVLDPKRSAVHVAVREAVARAIASSRAGLFITRAARRLLGHDLDIELRPRVSFSTAELGAFSAAIEAAVTRPPRPPRVTPHPSGLAVVAGRDGVEVDGGRLQRRIERALTNPRARRSLSVPVRRIRPRVTLARLARRYPSYITVDRTAFQLRVYQHLKLARSYPIAVGQLGLETPAGLYHIQNKQIDPTWSVPRSAWAGSLAGAVIPPGPSNPLKARWMGIFDGAGIHGTDQEWSLGSAASHGCIRMAVDDVIDLYDRVEVGTLIYIG